jgi:hypothetical protein
MDQSGLILRVIPYSDNGRIIKCLTEAHGLQAYFIRGSKKSRNNGFVQTGTYIAFTLNERPSKMPSIKDCQPDQNFSSAPLPHEAFGVWFFTLELLSKSLEDGFSIPGLRRTIDLYYTHLNHGSISCSPATPAILLATAFGIWDTTTPISASHNALIEDLTTLGIAHVSSYDGEHDVFHTIVNRFKAHFGIQKLDSLVLLG